MKYTRSLVTCCLALIACFAFAAPAQASASDHILTISAAPAVHVAASPAKSPLGPLGSLSLLGFAFAGATDEAKRKKVTLRRAYLFNGETLGPGRDVDVPADFPDLDEYGNVKHPEGSLAAKNAAASRPNPVPAGTASIDSQETVSGKSFEELSSMRKSELEELAVESGIDVQRGDGESGSPLVEDYVTALSAPKTA